MRASGAMPEPTWLHAAALAAAPIFDDSVYLSEALGLPVHQTEDDVDAELLLLARESGVQDPYRFLSPPHYISRAISTMTVDSEPRSSMSLHSQETQSTSLTSAPSRTSRDHLYTERSPARRAPPPLTRTSLSADRHTIALDTSTPKMEPSHSTSTLSGPLSALSSSSSLQEQQQQQPPQRKKRASNLFSMFRKDSSACSSRSHHGIHSKSRGTKLACGHTLSTFAVRVHVQEFSQSGDQVAPNCCGRALPRTVLEGVLTKEETDVMLNGIGLQSPDFNSLPDSGYSENGMSSIELPRSTPTSPITPTSKVTLPSVRRARHQELNVDLALANEAFTSFRIQQKEQFERVAMFECHQRKALSAHHQCSLKRLTSQHKISRDERIEQHPYDLERLEEKQISAEHDLRTTHEQETQNVATALKHMEAYCLSTNALRPEHAHIVTEEDFKKLDRQRMVQQDLPRKHENAINVLRARQERETKRRIEKQEAELDSMDAENEKDKFAEETNHKKELERLDAVIEARRRRLLQRWDLKFEMWRRDWEEQHGTTLDAKLEHKPWPPRKADHAVCLSDSSSLAQYINAAA